MVYAFIIGCVLGFSKEPIYLSFVVLLVLVIFKGTLEIVYKKNWVTGGPSNYVLYLNNLKKKDGLDVKPWLSYIFLLIATGSLTGAAGFALTHYLF